MGGCAQKSPAQAVVLYRGGPWEPILRGRENLCPSWVERLGQHGLGLGAMEAQRFSERETSARHPSDWTARLGQHGLGLGAMEAQMFSERETSARHPSVWAGLNAMLLFCDLQLSLSLAL